MRWGDILVTLKHICLIVTVVWTLVTTEGKSRRTNICRDPQPMEASFYMLQEFREGVDMDIDTEKQVHLYGERSCRLLTSQKKDNGSGPLCPVFYNLNYDSRRIPELIAEAKCACANCGGTSTGFCSSLFYYRSVLELELSRGCYRRVVRQFQNGCVCNKSFRSRLSRKKPRPKRKNMKLS